MKIYQLTLSSSVQQYYQSIRKYNPYDESDIMSKELRDKADVIIRELKDALIPLKEEIQSQKSVGKQ